MPMSDTEIALLDAIKSVADVLISMNEGAATALETSFAHQRDEKLRLRQPEAYAVFELLRAFVADPERKRRRAEVRRILSEEPKGQA